MKLKRPQSNKRLWLTAAFFILASLTFAGARFAGLFPTFNHYPSYLNVDYSYFVDSSNSHILKYVRESAIFRHIDNPNDIPWELGRKSYWVKLEVANLESEHRHLVLYFDTPMIDRLSIYRFSDDNTLLHQWHLGDSVERGYKVGDMPPAVNFMLEGFDSATVYMQIYSAGYPAMPIWLMDNHDYLSLTQLLHALWGSFIAVMLLVAIYTFAVYASLKERVYLVYGFYVITSLVLLGAVHGFGVYVFPEPIQIFFSNNTVSLTFGLFFLALLYAHLYLRVNKTNNLLRQVVIYALMVLSGLTLIALVVPEHIGAIFLLATQPLFYTLIGVLVWKRWGEAKKWSWMFIVSWIPLVVAGVFPPLLTTGYIEYTLLSRYAFLIGTAASVLFMALALAERFRQQREMSVYELTHDMLSLTPNVSVVSMVLDGLINTNKPFTFCCFQIARYRAISPYMSLEEKKNFISEVCHRLNVALDSDSVVVLENSDDTPHRIASIKEAHFGFIVLSSNEAKISLLLNTVLDEIDSYVEVNNLSFRIQGSVGSSQFPKDGGHTDAIMNKALQAVAETSPFEKRIMAYDSLNNFNHTLNMSLVSDLKRAIERDELELYHQPQIDLRTGNIHGSEVLLRWEHPRYGAVSPDVFVQLAEEVGLINDLTLWVIKRALAQQSKLLEMGYSRRLSVNISAADIAIPNLVERIAEMAEQYRVPTGSISLELTESTLVSDYERLHQVIETLSHYDIEVSIDDYGTGYSSLTYLSQLPFTELKIDRTFIMSLTCNPRKQNIVRATTEMAKSLGLMVVAEGVEDLETASLLKRYGVDIAQGYHYSRPLSFSQYVLYLKRTSNQMPVPIKRPRQLGAQSG